MLLYQNLKIHKGTKTNRLWNVKQGAHLQVLLVFSCFSPLNYTKSTKNNIATDVNWHQYYIISYHCDT